MMKRLLLYIIILVSLEGKAQNFTGRVENMSGKPRRGERRWGLCRGICKVRTGW